MPAGHCVRHPELVACDLVLWEPTQGRGRKNCIDALKGDAGLLIYERCWRTGMNGVVQSMTLELGPADVLASYQILYIYSHYI